MAKTERFWYIDRVDTDTSLTPDDSTMVIGLVEKSVNAVTRNGYTSNYKSIAVTGTNNLRLYTIERASDLDTSDLSNTFFSIPSHFHEALVYKVIARGYEDPRAGTDVQKAAYFATVYDNALINAKKYSRSNYTTTGIIAPQEF